MSGQIGGNLTLLDVDLEDYRAVQIDVESSVMASFSTHLPDELKKSGAKVWVDTRYGRVQGSRAVNGCPVFLGEFASLVRLLFF